MFICFLLWTVKYDKTIYSFSTPKYDKVPFLQNTKRKKKTLTLTQLLNQQKMLDL